MNDRQLRSFVLAAENKSFTKAAALSFVSPPALINQVNLLEKDSGITLFHRSAHGITLTEDGEIFYETACKILHLYDSTVALCSQRHKDQKMTLRIAGVNLRTANQFTYHCSSFMKENPNIQIHFVQIPLEQKISALTEEKADLMVVAEPDTPYLKEFRYTPIAEDTYNFFVSSSHPLARKELLTKKDLDGYSCVCDRRHYRREDISQRLEGSGANLIYTENEIDEFEIMSETLKGNIVVRYKIWADVINNQILKMIPSDIPAGNIGFLRKKNCDPLIDRFIEEFLKCFVRDNPFL